MSRLYDNTVQFWDVETGQAIGSALKNHTDWVKNVVFSPDGQSINLSAVDSAAFMDVQLCSATTFIDELGFLQHAKTRLLWLPTILRGQIAVLPSMVAVGSQSGAISFIKWPVESSSMIV